MSNICYPQHDRYFGKLALFDKFALHYLNHMRWELPDILEVVSKIRQDHIKTFTNIETLLD